MRPLVVFGWLALLLAGCSNVVHLQADHGGFLTDEEIRPLDTVAQSTAATEQYKPDGPKLPEYVFAFQPGFDVSKVASLRIIPFTSVTKDGQEIARDIPPAIISRAASNKIIPTASMAPSASMATSEIAPDEYVLSGAVTRTISNDSSTATILNFLHETSVAMRLSRDNKVFGVI